MIKKYSDYLLSALAPVLLFLILTVTAVTGSGLIFYPVANAESGTPTILVLGDSLSGAYGLNADEGWVALLQQQVTKHDYKYKVVNASVSGDTTRTGLGRIKPAVVTHQPQIVIIALGGNDGLRGLPFNEIETSLSSIIEFCQSKDAKLLLAGVRLPPNYGQVYNQKFAELYRRLAEKYKIPLVPKMLDRVADNPELMQQDGIHPKAEAQEQVMLNVWAGLKPVLEHTAAH